MFELKVVKAGLMAAAMASAIALAPVASAATAIVNGSFESPDASGDFVYGAGGWAANFNNTFTASNLSQPGGSFISPGAFDGTQVLKQYGVDGGSVSTSIDASEGDLVSASVQAMNWSGDTFNNLALLQIGYLDAGGGVIGVTETFADSVGSQDYLLTPQDGGEVSDWTLMEVSGLAPAGTVGAQILLLHIITDGTPNSGSVFWDDASLSASPVPVPAAAWLFGSALLGLMGISRRAKR